MEESSNASSSMSITVEKTQAEQEPPHEALFLVLAYLPVYEILTMSRVCTSLRDAVNNDVLPWLNVVVERPLNSRLSDETLMKITSKANGRLKTLALMNCIHITDQGLQRVVEQNPFINKAASYTSMHWHNPRRSSKSCENIVPKKQLLKQLEYKRHLQPTDDMLTLNLRKNLPLEEQQKQQQPIYYHKRGSSSVFKHEENQRIIDLEVCPKCFEVEMVYDCPKGDCKRKEWHQAQCRGCIFCIPRCENCGECDESGELEEGACGDTLCLECWLQLNPKCNFCNKPYCKQHTNWWCTSSDSLFLCKVCDENSHGYTYNDVL